MVYGRRVVVSVAGFLLLLTTVPGALAATATALIPAAAPRGARVIVTGSGLDAADVTVTFATAAGTAPAAIVERTPEVVEAIVPSNATSGPARVASGAGTLGTFAFTLTTDPAYTHVATLARGSAVGLPTGIAVHPATGDMFVADTTRHQILRITAGGTVSTFSGGSAPGHEDGPAATAKFKLPNGLAYDAARAILYVADTENHCIRKVAANGSVTTLAGSSAGDRNGTGSAARFNQPRSIALDASGNLYVSDSGNDKIRKITPAGAVTTFAGSGVSGYSDGSPGAARFASPVGLVIDASDTLYVADAGNHAIRKIANGQVTTVLRSNTLLPAPVDVALADNGALLVAESLASRVIRIDLQTTPATTSTFAGSTAGHADGAPASAKFLTPTSIAVDSGAIYVSDTGNAAIRTITSSPALTDLYPRHGPAAGGTRVRIFGGGFVAGATQVRFGAQAATNVSVAAGSEIFATAPAGTAGTSVDVVVTTAGGTATLAGKYTYDGGVDTTPPTITYTITPTPDAAGWTRADTTVTFTCNDAGSGIASCTAPVVVTDDTAMREVAGTAVDNSGNRATVTAVVKLDKTAPRIEYVLPPLEITRYFGKSSTPRDTTIVGHIVDATSGAAMATCNGAPAIVEDSVFTCTVTLQPGQTTIVAEVTDAAGNRSTVSRELTYIIDDTPPTIEAVLPPVNEEGWIRGTAIIEFACQDDQAIRSCGRTHYLGEGAGQRIEDKAVDAAGNETPIVLTLNVDGTPPRLQVTTPDASIVSAPVFRITGTATDALSGIRTIRCGDTPGTMSGDTFECVMQLAEGRHLIRVIATDAAGNEWSEEISVRRDATAPAVTITSPEDGLTTHTASVTISGSVEDDDRVAAVTVNGQTVTLDDDRFSTTVSLVEGANTITVRATDRAGNATTRIVTVRFLARASLTFTSPADLDVLRADAVNVTGTFAGPVAAIRVNGFTATLNGSTFSANDIPLLQGRTVITAIATTNGGQVTTASLNVYRDGIPPRVIVETPAHDSEVSTPRTIVGGSVDDIVIGTINAGQVTVTVNGRNAEVANRTFKASGIDLSPGENTLIVTAVDQGGNTTTVAHRVRYVPPAAARIVIAGGDDQKAAIGAQLPNPLRVRLLDAAGNPRAGVAANFTVTQNNGTLADGVNRGRQLTVVTNAQGEAELRWTLGTRAGVANQKVTVTANGSAPAQFIASASAGAPSLVVVDMGNGQFGVNGERVPRPLIAVVVDAGSNRLPGVPVTFTVIRGGGNIDGAATAVVVTDTDGRAWVTPTLGLESGFDNHVIRASVAGVASTAVFQVSSAPAGLPQDTKISGVVLDNTSLPVAGVTLRIEGSTIQTQSDAHGQFVISNAPIGYVRLIADGSTVNRPGSWPMLEYAMYTNAGQDNTIGMPIFMLPIDVARGVQVDDQRGGTITLPELPGFSLEIAPGSVTFPGGSRTGTVSATLVHSDKMPMVPGFGQQPRFLLTIQPAGAHFDPPARLTMPNLDGLAPGQVTELYSFDHDLGQYVAIGTGSVSEDGTTVRSDAGIGIIKAGWHCGGDPAATGEASCVTVELEADDDDSNTTAAARRSRVATHLTGGRPATSELEIDVEKTALAGTCVKLTAKGFPAGKGTYKWLITSGDAEFVSEPPECADEAECVAKVRANEPGDVVVTVTFKAKAGEGEDEKEGEDTKTAKITFVKVEMKVKEVSFEGDLRLIRDLPGVPARDITDPVWRRGDAAALNGHVAYVGSANGPRKIRVKVKFEITPASPSDVDMEFEGEVPSDVHGFPGGFLRKTVKVEKDKTEITVDDWNVEFDLPSTTYFFDPFFIQFNAKPKNACTSDPPSIHGGSIGVPLYVTLDTPVVSPLYLSIVHIATAGPPAATKEAAADATWAKFGTGTGPANVKGWDGRAFVYYPAGIGFGGVEVNEMDVFLRDMAGRCGVMMKLMLHAMKVNNLDATAVVVLPQPNCTGEGCADSFLVKNWIFGTPSLAHLGRTHGLTHYKYKMITITHDPPNEMVPAPDPPNGYGDLTNAAGIPGQNSPTPSEKTWSNHAIMKVGGRWLDPSYGVVYRDEADFQAKALDGWWAPLSAIPNLRPAPDPKAKIVRKPGPDTGVIFRELPNFR